MNPTQNATNALHPLIVAKNLSIGYGKKIVSTHIQFDLLPGSLWGLIGPNGSGKTTFIRTLMNILKPLKGTLLHKNGIRFGYVKQRESLNVTYPVTVYESVLMGRYQHISLFRRPSSSDQAKVEKALSQTGIDEFRNIPIRELSGGQKQRVLIARALASEPDLLVLDEPTNDMDIAGEESILALILQIHRETEMAVLLISHLLPVVFRVAEHLLFFKEQQVFTYSKKEFVEKNLLEYFYHLPLEIVEEGSRYSVQMKKMGMEKLVALEKRGE